MINTKQLWLVGKLILNGWEVKGVFDDEELAKKACLTSCHFIGPLLLNEFLPEASTEWPGAMFPNLDDCVVQARSGVVPSDVDAFAEPDLTKGL